MITKCQIVGIYPAIRYPRGREKENQPTKTIIGPLQRREVLPCFLLSIFSFIFVIHDRLFTSMNTVTFSYFI